MNQIIGPSQVDSQFVQACGQLNNLDLTYNNISSLNGNCYLTCQNESNCVTMGKCMEEHIQQFIKFKDVCGDTEKNNVNDDINDITYTSNNNYEPTDSFYRCVDEYIKEYASSSLSISSLGTFSLSQKDFNDNWVCGISTVGSKIRAVPRYFYD